MMQMTVKTDKESLFCLKESAAYMLAVCQQNIYKQQLMDEVWGYETEADHIR